MFFLVVNTSFAQDKKNKVKNYKNDFPAYVIYNSQGKRVTFNEMMDKLGEHDICLFGELHDDPISHWMEKTITLRLFEQKGSDLIIGGEMWETDQQLIMDEFTLHRLIDKKAYTEGARNWPNFRDYKPLVGIALRNNLKFVCSNIPRRYANIIYKKGPNYLDSLPEEAYKYLPPMPIHFDLNQPAYKAMGSIFGPDKDVVNKSKVPMMNYKGSNLVKAQAIKDATMAYNILKFWKKGKYMIHYNGVYHSQNHQSICYYLKYYNPDIDFVTISVAKQDNVLELKKENNTGDFNIIVSENMTTTY